MQPPQWLQPVRVGPCPSKNGSATVTPSWPKKMPTPVASKVSAWPRSSAILSSVWSAGQKRGLVVVPSMRLAVW